MLGFFFLFFPPARGKARCAWPSAFVTCFPHGISWFVLFQVQMCVHGAWPKGACCLSLPTAVPVLSCEAATQTEGRPDLAAVTLRRGLRSRASRCRPRSLIDYKSYMDTKLLVARFLEQSSCSMTPDIHELVENIKSVLKSDEEYMEEAITSASFLEQVVLLLISGMNPMTCFHSS